MAEVDEVWRCDLKGTPCVKLCESEKEKHRCGINRRDKMKEMISKELLSEVLNFNFQGLRDYKVDRFCFPNENTIAVEYKNEDGWIHINIYELAHKCKVWASGNRMPIWSKVTKNKAIAKIRKKIEERNHRNTIFASGYVDSEPEAIFKVAQWILNNQKK